MNRNGKPKAPAPSKLKKAILQSLRLAVQGKKAKKKKIKGKEINNYKHNSKTRIDAGPKCCVPSLNGLIENGRDYSKPSLESQINETQCNKKKSQWVSIISIPMGGQNKRR